MRADNVKIQSGRSMVEMIGVLAIVAVISVAGLYLYRIAVSKMRANELVHEVNKRAYDCAANILVNTDHTSLQSSFASAASTTGDIVYALRMYDEFFAILASNIDEDICRKAIVNGNRVPYAVVDDCANGKIAFYYRNDMGECTDPEICVIPEECEDESKQCGYRCCDHCVENRCCPELQYITADYNYNGTGELCCVGDEIAVEVEDTGKYICKTPAVGDKCIDKTTNLPDQSKCNKSGEEKLYCKVTAFNGCNPSQASCQKIPTITSAELMKAGTISMQTWKKADELMDWWSAKDLCDALGMELPTQDSFCGTDHNCATKATPIRTEKQLGFGYSDSYNIGRGGGGVWLDSKDGCNAFTGNEYQNSYYLSNNAKKASCGVPICQPKGYTEPDCPNGQVYNVSSNTCE